MIVVAVALAICGLGVAVLAGAGSATPEVVSTACGGSTLATISNVDRTVAGRVYGDELVGPETRADLQHITGAGDLLAAVAADSRAATLKAVQRIVYHGFWHIVRLRALDVAGRILADVGGPYVIAPVSGVLAFRGAVVGGFVMSVQDDVGFTKLEHRFVGDPIGIYVHGRLVVELGGRFPRVAPGRNGINLGATHYSTTAMTYSAFPGGTLSAVIAVPAPAASLTAQPCAAVAVGEIGRVAERIASLFRPLAARYGAFVPTAHTYTGAIVVVRIGMRVIAGSDGPGPATLPTSGTVSYLAKRWSVFSFAPTPPARIYLLISPA